MTSPERLARALTVAAAIATASYPVWAHHAAATVVGLAGRLAPLLPGTDRSDRGR